MFMHRALGLTFVLLVTLAGCSRKATPVTIEGFEVRKDEARKFEIKVPKNWFVQQRRGDLILAVSTKAHSSRFLSFAKGKGGAKAAAKATAPADAEPAAKPKAKAKTKAKAKAKTAAPKKRAAKKTSTPDAAAD